MEPLADRLRQLKEKLAGADELSDVFKFFFDHLGNDPAFIQRGKPAKHEILKTVLKTICKDMFGDESKVTGLKLFNAEKTNFFHGICQMSGKTASVLYFNDIEMGMIAIMVGPVFGQFSYVRFTATSVDAKGAGRVVAPERKTIQ